MSIADIDDSSAEWLQMKQAMKETEKGIALFLNSQFSQAESLFAKEYKTSLYHSLGYSCILFIKTLMTLSPEDIKSTLAVMDICVNLADKARKKESMFSFSYWTTSWTQSLAGMTPVQRHAELIYAEIYILKALLTVLLEEESGFVVVIKEALNIRNSYLIYKNCSNFLKAIVKGKEGIESVESVTAVDQEGQEEGEDEDEDNQEDEAEGEDESSEMDYVEDNAEVDSQSQNSESLSEKLNNLNVNVEVSVTPNESQAVKSFTQVIQEKSKKDADQQIKTEKRKGRKPKPVTPLPEEISRGLSEIQKSAGNYKLSAATVDKDFISGVTLGMGLFNLMISMLPPKIIKLVEIVGFSGDRDVGLREFEVGVKFDGLRSDFCLMALAAYHSTIAPYCCAADYQLPLAEGMVNGALVKYPNSSFYHFLKGSINLLKKEITDGMAEFNRAIACQNEMKQIHHLCQWELLMAHARRFEFEQSHAFAHHLAENNNWSKIFYLYLEALFSFLKDGSTVQVKEKMAVVGAMRRRVAGKSIPLEKFVSRKARKYVMQGEFLLLPGLEFMLIWNDFDYMEIEWLDKSLAMVEEAKEDLMKYFDFYNSGSKKKQNISKSSMQRSISQTDSISSDSNGYRHHHFWDDLALVYILEAVILRAKGCFKESAKAFNCLFSIEKKIKLDHYYAPMGHLEFARLIASGALSQGNGTLSAADKKLAKIHFEKALKDYTNHSLENMINMRVHNSRNSML